MKNKFLLCIMFILIIAGLYVPASYSQIPTYTCTLANDVLTAPNVYEFDVFLLRTGTVALELGGFQIGLTYDTTAINGGTLTASWVAGTTDPIFLTYEQLPNPAQYSSGIIRVASFQPPGRGNGTIIPNVAPGARIGRLRLTNSIPFTSTPLSANWVFSKYQSKISAYIAGTNTDITSQLAFLNSLGGLKLTLTAFLEGYSNAGGTAMLYAPSAVTVELHNATSPFTLVESQTAPLSISGVGTFTFTTAVNGTNYFIVVKTWNTIETWSGAVQSFTGSALSYDFTSAATQAYGSNMVLKGSNWFIYSGDVDQGGYVGAGDLSLVANDNASFVSGSTATDVNGDGYVGAADLSIVANNNTLFVAKVLPPGAPSAISVEQLKRIHNNKNK